MTQLSMFDTAPKKRKREHSPESLAANATVDKEKWRALVLAQIVKRGRNGVTADELAAHFRVSANSVAPRLTELKRSNTVVGMTDKNGEPVRRETRAGCFARVFVHVHFKGE